MVMSLGKRAYIPLPSSPGKPQMVITDVGQFKDFPLD